MDNTQLGERIARLEGMLESHEKNAIERKSSIEKKFDTIFSKLDSQNCTLHAARMIEIQQNYEKLESKVDENDRTSGSRLTFMEKAYWTGMGGLAVLMALLKWVL